MIIKGTFLACIDNSGARTVQCIHIFKKSSKSCAKIGDVLLVSVKRYAPNKKVKKGNLYKAILVKTKNNILKHGNNFICFNESAVVLLNLRFVLLGTRILNPVSSKLREFGYFKILALAPIAV